MLEYSKALAVSPWSFFLFPINTVSLDALMQLHGFTIQPYAS